MWDVGLFICHFLIEDNSTKVLKHQVSFISSLVSRLSFCIGRMTESAARKHGFETVTSDETTMDSLVKKIVEHYKKES